MQAKSLLLLLLAAFFPSCFSQSYHTTDSTPAEKECLAVLVNRLPHTTSSIKQILFEQCRDFPNVISAVSMDQFLRVGPQPIKLQSITRTVSHFKLFVSLSAALCASRLTSLIGSAFKHDVPFIQLCRYVRNEFQLKLVQFLFFSNHKRPMAPLDADEIAVFQRIESKFQVKAMRMAFDGMRVRFHFHVVMEALLGVQTSLQLKCLNVLPGSVLIPEMVSACQNVPDQQSIDAIAFFHGLAKPPSSLEELYPNEIRALFGFPCQGRPRNALRAVAQSTLSAKQRTDLSAVIRLLPAVQRRSHVVCLESFARYGVLCDQPKYVEWCLDKQVNTLMLPNLFRYGYNQTMELTVKRLHGHIYADCMDMFPQTTLFPWRMAVCLEVTNEYGLQALEVVYKNHIHSGYAIHIGHARAAASVDSNEKLVCLKKAADDHGRLLVALIKQCAASASALNHDDSSSGEPNEYTCAICLERMDLHWHPRPMENAVMEWPECHHLFHRECARAYVRTQRATWRTPCPLCRQPLGRHPRF